MNLPCCKSRHRNVKSHRCANALLYNNPRPHARVSHCNVLSGAPSSDDPRRAAKSAPLPLRPLDQALSRTLSLPLLPLKEAPSTRCHTPTVFFRVATIIGRLLQRVSLSHFVLSDRARSPTPLSLCRCLSSPPGRSSLITREGARWISFRSSARLARRR